MPISQAEQEPEQIRKGLQAIYVRTPLDRLLLFSSRPQYEPCTLVFVLSGVWLLHWIQFDQSKLAHFPP